MMRKSKQTFVLLLLTISTCILNAQTRLKVIDRETKEPVSFAIANANELNINYESDLEGVMHIEIKDNIHYTFSRLGYNSLHIMGSEFSTATTVEMSPLPVELNTVIVTADAAWFDLNRAIDSTFRTIPKPPFYLKCEQLDKVVKNNELAAYGTATIASKVTKLISKGKGNFANSKVIDLEVVVKNNIHADSIRRLPNCIVPQVNDFGFMIGKKRYDKDLNFHYIDINDSLVVIGYTPKQKFSAKRYILASGRVLINKKGWKIMRIDSDISPRMLDIQNDKAKTDLLHEYAYSIILSDRGLPTKLEQKFSYTLKNDASKAIWETSTTHKYTEISEEEYSVVPDRKMERKSLILQESYTAP